LNAGVSTIYSDARVEFLPDGGGSLVPTGLETLGGEDVLTFVETGDFRTIPFGSQFKDNLSRFISLNLNIPIFNRFNQRANVQRSKIQMQQASINSMEQRNILRQTIETAFNDAQAASKSYAAATRQVEALEETFRSIENQYNFGAANFTDYQVASNNLFRAKSDLSRAKFDYIFKKKLLDFYQGIPIF
jgi:outer membrane protein